MLLCLGNNLLEDGEKFIKCLVAKCTCVGLIASTLVFQLPSWIFHLPSSIFQLNWLGIFRSKWWNDPFFSFNRRAESVIISRPLWSLWLPASNIRTDLGSGFVITYSEHNYFLSSKLCMISVMGALNYQVGPIRTTPGLDIHTQTVIISVSPTQPTSVLRKPWTVGKLILNEVVNLSPGIFLQLCPLSTHIRRP